MSPTFAERTVSLPCPPERVDEFLSQPSAAVVALAKTWRGTVLVLGAGGKMGLHLSWMLAEAIRRAESPARVIAVSRFQTLRDRGTFDAASIQTIAADLHDERQVKRLPEAEVVFFLAGVKFGTTSDRALLQQMNVEVPRIVARRFSGARIVALSSGCVYPFVPVASGGATELTPVAPPGDYARSCLGRELEFSLVSQARQTPVALVRLNYAVEFRYGVLVDIATKVMRGDVVDVTTGHVNVIWQRDAIEHVILYSTLAASPAAPINLTGEAILSVRTLAGDFGRLLGAVPRIGGVESPDAWLNDASRAHQRFGKPSTSLAEMQQWIVAWLLAEGRTWGKPTAFENRNGNF
ncbi:MAG: NAD(P)-dependent oxidoreductase [Verrucomicrobiota bacterium]